MMKHLQRLGPPAPASEVKKEYVRKRLNDLVIREFSSKYSSGFKEINYEWLKESVGVSPYDEKVLNNPEDEIIKKGGKIYFAFAGTELTGTFILIPANKKDAELTKFAVKKSYRKMGIGKMLLNYAIEEAKRSGYNTLILLTHPALTEAINLYRKIGFTEIPGHPDLPDPTGRCSTTMQYIINH